MDQPIEYVGGQPERPPRRPWWLLAAVPTVLVLGLGIVFVTPGLVAAARSLSQATLPYTVAVRGTWSAPDQVVGGPVTLSLDVKNTDVRSLNGITVRMAGLSPRWMVLAATPDGQLNDVRGTSIYFARGLRPGESETLQVRLMPIEAGQTQIRLSMMPGRSDKAMTMVTATGRARGLMVSVSVRDAAASDLVALPHLFYTSPDQLNQSATFRVHLDNTGVVRITSVTVRFAQLPPSFELQSTTPAGTPGADGRSSTFPVTLDPGDGTDINIYYVPHQTGTYHVSIQLFLQDQSAPLVLPNGTQRIDVDVTVH